MMIAGAMIAIFCGAMLVAATSDLLSMTIRNRVSLVLAGGFLLLAPLTGMDWSTYGLHLATGCFVLSITFGLFMLRAMGGGDAKLISATAVWFGFAPVLAAYVLNASLLGGLLTILLIIYRAMPMPAIAGRISFMRHLARKDVGVPYGIALGAAGLWVFPQSAIGSWALQRLSGFF